MIHEWHAWMSHGTYEWADESRNVTGVIHMRHNLLLVTATYILNHEWHAWMSHGTYEWVDESRNVTGVIHMWHNLFLITATYITTHEWHTATYIMNHICHA